MCGVLMERAFSNSRDALLACERFGAFADLQSDHQATLKRTLENLRCGVSLESPQALPKATIDTRDLCFSACCLDADMQDFTRNPNFHSFSSSTSSALQQNHFDQYAQSHSQTRQSEPVAGVCIEGPFSRAAHLPLHRLVDALRRGLGNGVLLVAVVSVELHLDCKHAALLYEEAFGGSLAYFQCVVDTPLETLEADFVAHAFDSAWWMHNAKHFRSPRTNDVPNLSVVLRNIQMKSYCYDAMQIVERERSSSELEWMGYIRNDYDFFEAHPPLSMMSMVSGIWVVDGEDYGGLNDRWAIMHRSFAASYFRRWEAFVDGSALAYLKFEVDSIDRFGHRGHLNSERCLLLHLHHAGVWPLHVHRFLTTAALRCTSSSVNCDIQSELVGRKGWRNTAEWADAHSVAIRLRDDRWSWDFTRPRHLGPECFPADECCVPSPLGGNHTCFDGIFHTYTRCCDNSFLLSIVPPQTGPSLPFCWDLAVAERAHMVACVDSSSV